MITDDRPLRLFVAVDVPLDQRLLLHEAMEPHRAAFPAARWIAPERQHLTLKFLGRTAPSSMARLDGILRAVTSRGRSGRVALTELGVFPSMTRARVLWVGLSDPRSVLAGLAGALDGALEEMEYPVEKRSFTPHLTLARFKAPVRLHERLPVLPEGRFDSFAVERVVLYSSRLHPHGARYEPVTGYALGGAPETRP